MLYNDYLAHHGIKGQKWGVRRFQNEDGMLTAEGRDRYGVGEGFMPRTQRKTPSYIRKDGYQNRSNPGERLEKGLKKQRFAAKSEIRKLVKSNTNSTSKKGKKELTPEEKAERKRKLVKGLVIGATAAAAVGGLVAYYKSTKLRDVLRADAEEKSNEARGEAFRKRHALGDLITDDPYKDSYRIPGGTNMSLSRARLEKKKLLYTKPNSEEYVSGQKRLAQYIKEGGQQAREAKRLEKEAAEYKKAAETLTRRDAIKEYARTKAAAHQTWRKRKRG